jgi:hypothetical protein
MAYATAFSSMI